MKKSDILDIIELAAGSIEAGKRVIARMKEQQPVDGAITPALIEAAEARGVARAHGVISQADAIDARLDSEK